MAGRQVFFAIGKHRRIPRRYRGHDVFWWRRELGHLDLKVGDIPREQREPPPLVTGVGGGHDIDIRSYAKNGMRLLGHVREISDGRVALAGDLGESLAAGDRAFDKFTSAVDDYLQCRGVGSSEAHPPTSPIGPPCVEELDLRASHIQSVVWATGYDLDFRWIELPIFDARGEPVQERGVTSAPGIYFLGLFRMHKVKSSFLYGVGEDAQYLAETMCEVPPTLG